MWRSPSTTTRSTPSPFSSGRCSWSGSRYSAYRFFALAGGLSALGTANIKVRFGGRAMPVPAWFLIVVGVLFMLLWLSEIVPDLLGGDPSRSARMYNVPTNPVHVLDLAFFLPAVVTSGVLLLRRHPWGYASAGGGLVWLALTAVPILVTPFVANARGHEPGWVVMIPIGVVLIATLAVLGVLLWRVSAQAGIDYPPKKGQNTDL